MFKVLKDYCQPVRGTKYSAYVDLFSVDDVIIGVGETKIVKLGVKLDLEELINSNDEIYNNSEMFLKSHYLEVALRSSLAVKGLIIANGIGVIDLDFKNELGLIVHNPIQRLQNFQGGYCEVYPDIFYINKGDKVAQACLKEHKSYLLGYETETIRTGGYGSTGN